jgi:two-component system sensor histidine kinase VicK
LTEDIIEETKFAVPSHAIKLTHCEPVLIFADQDKISSVISNLLSNAVKYSAKDTTIYVKCEIANNMARVSVKDEGVGIKPHDLDRLFERYYRVDDDVNQHISGFGIGLYLSAEIIQRHDGKIGVESEVGKGSTFWFTLPLK